MRNALYLILTVSVCFLSCKEENQCMVCPDNYILVDDSCECNGVMLLGECYTYDRLFQYNTYISENGDCLSTLLGSPAVIDIEFHVEEKHRQAKVSFHKPGELWSSTITVYGSDSAYYIPSADRGFSNSLAKPGEEFDFYTREIEGETQYLRVYLKKLHDKYFRVHFTWETRWGTERERCTRIFHQ